MRNRDSPVKQRWTLFQLRILWNKKPTRCHLVLYLFLLYKLLFISCSTCFGPPCVHLQELTTWWYFFTCGVVPWLCRQSDPVGCWLPTQTRHYTTREKILLSRQLLKMGTRWPETCWATYKEQLIKENHKVCHPRCVFKQKLELCVYLSDTTIRWKMYVYLLHKINYMFRPYFHWPSSGW